MIAVDAIGVRWLMCEVSREEMAEMRKRGEVMGIPQYWCRLDDGLVITHPVGGADFYLLEDDEDRFDA